VSSIIISVRSRNCPADFLVHASAAARVQTSERPVSNVRRFS
jgi:hypothetical protein